MPRLYAGRRRRFCKGRGRRCSGRRCRQGLGLKKPGYSDCDEIVVAECVCDVFWVEIEEEACFEFCGPNDGDQTASDFTVAHLIEAAGCVIRVIRERGAAFAQIVRPSQRLALTVHDIAHQKRDRDVESVSRLHETPGADRSPALMALDRLV